MDESPPGLRRLDEVEATDLWQRITTGTLTLGPRGRSTAQRIAAGILAGSVGFAAIALSAALLGRGDRGQQSGHVVNGSLVFVRTSAAVGVPRESSVWMVDPDGSRLRRVRGAPGQDDPTLPFVPRWSADGRRLLWYAPDGHSSSGSIWVKEPGDGPHPTISCDSISCGIWDPEWSPDGTRIAFVKAMAIYVVAADGSGLRRIAECRGCTDIDSGPTWAPDGFRLAFAASDANYQSVIYTMDADGSNPRQIHECGSALCTAGARARSLDWSPTGNELVFVSERNVWIISADGRELHRLSSCPATRTPNACEPGNVSWSPDGNTIAYDGNGRLVLVGADGRNETEIEVGAGLSYLDSWQPRRVAP
jgi:Tol biopolymer transport system component